MESSRGNIITINNHIVVAMTICINLGIRVGWKQCVDCH